MAVTVPRDYSHLAPIYDQFFHHFLKEGHEKIGEMLGQEKGIRGKKILEVGVGSGLTLSHLPAPIDYTGVDINEKMLELAYLKIATMRRKNYRVELMNAEKLRFKKDYFDYVIAASVLTAVEDPAHTMKEMIRVTKRKGKIAIVANLRRENTFSEFIRHFDPLTKKYLGFRTDLNYDYFTHFKSIRLIGQIDVNKVFGLPLSSFLLFEKN